MNFILQDLSYYERTIGNVVKQYYYKRILIVSIFLIVGILFTMFFPSYFWLSGIFIVAVLTVLSYAISCLLKYQKEYEKTAAELIENFRVHQVEEDMATYNLKNTDGTRIKILKQASRNLPSNQKEYTLFVGVPEGYFPKPSFVLFYYNIYDLTYSEKYRLQRNSYSRLPRFLRRFTWSNIKSSLGNFIGYVLGNVFLFYMLIRLILYFIRMF